MPDDTRWVSWLGSNRAGYPGSRVKTVPPSKRYDTQDMGSNSALSAATRDNVLNNRRRERLASVTHPHRWQLINRYFVGCGEGDRQTVRQEELRQGLGTGQECDVHFLQATTRPERYSFPAVFPTNGYSRPFPRDKGDRRVRMTVSLLSNVEIKNMSASSIPQYWGAMDRSHFHFRLVSAKLMSQSSRVTDCVTAVLQSRQPNFDAAEDFSASLPRVSGIFTCRNYWNMWQFFQTNPYTNSVHSNSCILSQKPC